MAGGSVVVRQNRYAKPPPHTPSRIRGKKIAPPHDTVRKFCSLPSPYALKTCLYVAIVPPQQL